MTERAWLKLLRIVPEETEINIPCPTTSFQRLTQSQDDVISTHLKTEEYMFNETMRFTFTETQRLYQLSHDALSLYLLVSVNLLGS